MRTTLASADWWPGLRGRLLRAGSLRGVRAVAVLAGLACTAGLVQAAHPFPSPLLASTVSGGVLEPYDLPAVAGAAPLHIVEPAYSLWAEPGSAVVTLASASGRVYTSLPLCMLAGRTSFPAGTTARTTLENGALHTRMLSRNHTVLSDAVLRPGAQSFTVSFSALLGADRRPLPAFFSDGERGMAMATIEDGYTPDARGPSVSAAPAVSTVGRAPFAPPPFDVELRSEPGWFGVGLVQVPAATVMRVSPDGSVTVDYPLAPATMNPDYGAGTPVAGRLRFPDFVVTFAPDPETGLRAYHDALASRHALTVASPPGSRPAWWSDTLVDTWGEQMATGAQRSSPLYTAGWVRHFVADWRARYHVEHFTVVIDSRWQERVGDAMPDVVRFGGLSGMRALISELHAQGLHVLLWWPMWAHGVDKIPLSARQVRLLSGEHLIDPTSPEFQSSMASTLETLLGSGPDALGADGLKLDWQYDLPQVLARPDAGSGALALYRYMDTIHRVAHSLRHDAMIDASAAAPQFAAVADTVRLYDAWSPAEWERRAAIVAAVDPDVLIDGDGWQVDAADIVPHTVSSTVYGTPAMYFSSTWMGHHLPIPPALSSELGAVLSLSALKGQGHAVALADGEWEYEVGGVVTAHTFAGDRALVVRAPQCTPTWRATVTSTIPGQLLVPMNGNRLVSASDAARHPAPAIREARGVMLTVRAGELYQLVFSGGC
jgi:hypothetical protein